MPTFILCNLAICYLIKTENSYIAYLNTNVALIISLCCVILSLIAGYSKKVSPSVWYDMLGCSILFTWLSYWLSLFDIEAPMFFFFPLFFAVMTAFVDIKFIHKKKHFDHESIETIKYYSSRSLLHPALIISLVLLSILITSHFLLFPVFMNAFIVRYTLSSCLYQEP